MAGRRFSCRSYYDRLRGESRSRLSLLDTFQRVWYPTNTLSLQRGRIDVVTTNEMGAFGSPGNFPGVLDRSLVSDTKN
jgi:hypothetical protein